MGVKSPVIGYIKLSDSSYIYVYKIDTKESKILCVLHSKEVKTQKRWYRLHENGDYNVSRLYFRVDDSVFYVDEIKSIKSKPKLGYLLAQIC